MGKAAGFSARNDGVVDTSSMRAPAHEAAQDIDHFNMASIGTNRGVYWDLGLTEGIDHADEVGVFTVPGTVSVTAKSSIANIAVSGRLLTDHKYEEVLRIYQLLGELLSAL